MFWLLLVTVIILFYLDDRALKRIKGIPGPKKVPFLGNVITFLTATDLFHLCDRLWHEYGSRYHLFMGHRAYIMISDPKDVEAVMNSNDFMEKGDEYFYLKPWLGNGILMATGDDWRAQRKMITPAFNFKIQDNLMDIVTSQTDTLINVLSQHVDGECVDLLPLVSRYTLDVIIESTVGMSVNVQTSKKAELADAMETIREIVFKRIITFHMRFDFLFKFSKDFHRYQDALKKLDEFLKGVIEKRKKVLEKSKETIESFTDENGAKKKVAFMDLFLLSKLHGKPLDGKGVQDEVNSFLFAGYDTLKSAISFTLHLISNNSCVQQKLLDEQITIFGDDFKRNTTTSDLSDMKYMEMVIKEALRLFPPAPIFTRKTLKDTMINDLHVPAETSIVFLIYNMHRDPKVFPDPEKFIPERFSHEEPVKKSQFAPMAFSGGPRNCIGQKFAMMEMKVCISKVIREYELLPSFREFELRGKVTLVTDEGLFVKFKKRQQNSM